MVPDPHPGEFFDAVQRLFSGTGKIVHAHRFISVHNQVRDGVRTDVPAASGDDDLLHVLAFPVTLAAMIMLISYRMYSGTATRIWLNTSGEGVMMALTKR